MNMHASDWPELFAMFERMVDAPLVDRQRLLDEVTRDQPEMRLCLERLLALDASERDFVASVAVWRDRLLDASVDEAVPTRIGAWKIIRPLGAGGMGRVFLAERADGEYEQQVALKIIRGEFTSDAAIARFLAERRILARLDHRGIASLVDGGVDEHGRPWFAMQYVDGGTLPDYCTQHGLGIDARLQLMIGVCKAVAYAHRQLVVHCDLKPSNVLVDANGQPRLLDFGIARLLGADSASLATQTYALTPGYAAPEQLAGRPVSVATDVYALGVMLYEVLVGSRPNYSNGADPKHEVTHASSDPPLPSRAASPASPVPARRLRGDLDLIAATALRHDPARRYADASKLAEDLRRHLDGFPLRARRASTIERTRKFIGRHRMAVGLSALAIAALLVTTTFALNRSLVARHEAANAIAVRDFLVSIFRSADPRAGKGGIDTRILIDRGSAGLDASLKTQPELASSFAEVLGHVYLQLAAYDEAQTMFDRALALTGERYGADSAQNAPILRALAQTLAERNHLDDAKRMLARASAIDEHQHGTDSPEAIADSALAANMAQRGGDLDRARGLIDDTISRARALKPVDQSQLANYLNRRANIEETSGALEDAEHDTREALDLFRRQNGEESLDVAENLINLGVLAMRRGDASHAEPIFRQGLATYRRLLPAEHPLIADAMTNLARSLDREGKPDQAEPIYIDALAVQRHLFGDVHADVATTLNNLAVLYVGRGDYVKARTMMQQVVDVWTQLAGAAHPLALASRGNLGVIEREQGDYAAARITLQSALDDYRKQPASAARQAYCLDQLGILLRYEGKPLEALELHHEAETLRASVEQLGPIEKAAGLIALSLGETASGHAQDARQHADAAISLLDAAKAQSDARYADALLARARAAIAIHEMHEATVSIAAAGLLRKKLYARDDWHNAEIDLVHAEIEAASGDQQAAHSTAQAARAIFIAQRGLYNPLVREADLILHNNAVHR